MRPKTLTEEMNKAMAFPEPSSNLCIPEYSRQRPWDLSRTLRKHRRAAAAGPNRYVWLVCIGAFTFQTAFGTENTIQAELIEGLRKRITEQEKQIAGLQAELAEQRQVLDKLTQADGQLNKHSLADAQEQGTILGNKSQEKSFHGFLFSGDFRLRFDGAWRSGNVFAGPLQNMRSRYRVRFNVDKEFAQSNCRFRFQLSTGAYSNGLTNDQDFGGIAKNPFAISEAYVDCSAHKRLLVRAGRMSEVFTDDDMRFLSDDNVRFTGAHQIVKVPLGRTNFFFDTLEFRIGEYILSNPAVAQLQANSPYLAAGYTLGQRVPDATLIHPGFVLSSRISPRLKHRFMAAIELYRNQNQIQLASTQAGIALSGNPLGLTFSDPLNESGNAVIAPGSAMLAARHFQIVHVGYTVESKLGGREVPFFIDLQASRNVGTGKYRDALMASISVGNVKNFGDTRYMYQFGIKDANSMISQYTDDDFGTGTGVNIAVHSFRFYLGLTKFLQFQNLFFIQNELRGNNPSEHFFVPVPRGVMPTFRYLGQLAFTF